MESHAGLLDFLFSLKRRSRLPLATTAIGLLLFTAVPAMLVPTWYGVEVLIDSPTLPGTNPTSAVVLPTLRARPDNTPQSDLAEYLDFLYPTGIFSLISSKPAIVKRIEPIRDTSYVELEVWGKSTEEAEKLARLITKRVETYFAPRVEHFKVTNERRLDLAKQTYTAIGDGLKGVQEAIEKLGYSTSLFQRRDELERQKLEALKAISEAETAMGPENLRNIEVVELQPKSGGRSVFPPSFVLLGLIGAILGFLFGITLVNILAHLDVEVRQRNAIRVLPPARPPEQPPVFRSIQR